MVKELGVQHDVKSSNLKSIGFYFEITPKKTEQRVRIEFQRGAIYEYWPCGVKEFQEAFVPGVTIKDWFSKFKEGKQFKKIE